MLLQWMYSQTDMTISMIIPDVNIQIILMRTEIVLSIILTKGLSNHRNEDG